MFSVRGLLAIFVAVSGTIPAIAAPGCSSNADCMKRGLPLLKPRARGSPRYGRRDGVPYTIPYSGEITTYTIPASSNYSIVLQGGAGGGNELGTESAGGFAATITGKVYLLEGTVVSVAVGGQPANGKLSNGGSGGGGGTFVYLDDYTLIAAAGGGGGAPDLGSEADGNPASISTTATDGSGPNGGAAGTATTAAQGGGSSAYDGGGGASFLMNGAPSLVLYNAGTGGSDVYGSFAGGSQGDFRGTNGGFGGGGGGGDTAGGGGGGYYGGGGGDGVYSYSGGGGSSYFIASYNNYNTVSSGVLATSLGNGQVTITEVSN